MEHAEALVERIPHINWLETQLDLTGKIGIANYQQSQVHTDE